MIKGSGWALRALALGGLGLSLAGCGGGGDSATAVTSPVVTTTAQEDKFGTAFGTDFRASKTTEPVNVNAGDIVAVSLTTDPIAIN